MHAVSREEASVANGRVISRIYERIKPKELACIPIARATFRLIPVARAIREIHTSFRKRDVSSFSSGCSDARWFHSHRTNELSLRFTVSGIRIVCRFTAYYCSIMIATTTKKVSSYSNRCVQHNT